MFEKEAHPVLHSSYCNAEAISITYFRLIFNKLSISIEIKGAFRLFRIVLATISLRIRNISGFAVINPKPGGPNHEKVFLHHSRHIYIRNSCCQYWIRPGICQLTGQRLAAAVAADDDMEDRIRGADVLIYENPDKDLRLMMRVKRALKFAKINGGDVKWVGANLPLFTEELNKHHWDLVIMAVESRWTVELGDTGLLEQIYNHLEDGGALIVETWNLDEDESALGGLMLDVCDARLEKDWWRDKHADDYKRSDYMISENEDADTDIFSSPRKINMPLDPIIFWDGDAGDFIRLQSGSEAEILGEIPSSAGHHYGLLTSCLDGRMLLQTFSSHDYSLYESTNLWQNMMYYTLENHFEALDSGDYGIGSVLNDCDCDEDEDEDDCDCDYVDDEAGEEDNEYKDNWFSWEVEEGETCETIAAGLRTIDEEITAEDVRDWNELDWDDCDELSEGDVIWFFIDDEHLED